MTDEFIAIHKEDDDCLVMTYKNRNYFIREAGPDADMSAGNVVIMGSSGRRRKPIMMATMPLGNAFHEIIDGTIPKGYHTLFLLPEDFRTLKNIGHRSARKTFQVVAGGKR